MRRRFPARGFTERTSPRSVMMPVNISSPREGFERVVAQLFAAPR